MEPRPLVDRTTIALTLAGFGTMAWAAFSLAYTIHLVRGLLTPVSLVIGTIGWWLVLTASARLRKQETT